MLGGSGCRPVKGKTVGIIVVWLALLSFYLLFSGSASAYDIATGAVVALLVSLLLYRMLVSNPHKLVQVGRLLHLLAYTVKYFLVYEAKAHAEMVKIILSPRPSYRPAILRLPYTSETDYAVTLVANSITNTPGTLVVDLDPERKVFYVHWINATTLDVKEAYRLVLGYFDEKARKIFD